MSHAPVVPVLRKLMRMHLQVGAPQLLGEGPSGHRRIVPILGGKFAGEGLAGKVLPGGGDWLVLRRDHCSQLDARYTLECDDGAMIYVQDRGLRHGPEHTMARLARGEPVDPEDYYFRTSAVLETSSERHGWLNRMIVVGSGMRRADEVIIDFYHVG